jgi:hypothetical protein
MSTKYIVREIYGMSNLWQHIGTTRPRLFEVDGIESFKPAVKKAFPWETHLHSIIVER